FDWWNSLMAWLPGDDFPLYQDYGADEGTRYPEVAAALTGAATAIVRVDAKHQLVVSVAVPIRGCAPMWACCCCRPRRAISTRSTSPSAGASCGSRSLQRP